MKKLILNVFVKSNGVALEPTNYLLYTLFVHLLSYLTLQTSSQKTDKRG